MSPIVTEKSSLSKHLFKSSSSDLSPPLHVDNPGFKSNHLEHEPTLKGDLEFPPTVSVISKTEKIKTFFMDAKVEIVAFFFTFSYVLTRISSTSMIVEKVCLAHFGYPEDICRHLANHTNIKIEVERLSTNYQIGHTLIQTAPAALLSCFIGPWSDRYGRKLPVVVAIVGMTLDTLGSTICAYFLNSRVEFYYIPACFTGFCGGLVTNLAAVYSYASDFTRVDKRTMKYAFIEIACGIALPMGVATGGWMYNFFGYPSVYMCSTAGMFASLLWVVFLLPETRGKDNKDPWRTKLGRLFTLETFRESFIATTKERPYQGKKQIVWLIVSMCFIIVATSSTTDINFLFVHHQFDWGTTEYSTVTALYSVCAIFLLLAVIPLFKWLKAGDPMLGLVGTGSIMLKFVGIGLSFRTVIFHIANLMGLLSGCAALAVRSRISKVVSNDDLGKVFSFVATAESLLPVLTTVLISQIFNASLSVYPGLPYIVLATLIIIPFSVFIWLNRLPVMPQEELQKGEEKNKNSYTTM